MQDSNLFQTSSSLPHNENTRILLWDIDGTLMTSTIPGAYKRYFMPSLEKVFGTSGSLEEMTVSGMTDFQIAFEALQKAGFTVEQIRAKIPQMLEIFPVEMNRVLDGQNSHNLLGGVKEILAATKANPRYINGLLTGNLTPAAKIKLAKVGIEDEFDFEISAFGEISHSRNDLPFEAIKKARKKFNYEFLPSQFIIIGDTPNDIICARNCGAKVIAVATGRGQTMENLAEYKPDYLFKDFSDTKKVLEALETL